MLSQRLRVLSTCLAFTLLIPAIVFAESLVVRSVIMDEENQNGVVVGRMEVVVGNLTNAPMANVNLRLHDLMGGGSIDNGVFQLGAIPAGENRVLTGGFMLAEEILTPDIPLSWRVDYDDAQGDHQSIITETQK